MGIGKLFGGGGEKVPSKNQKPVVSDSTTHKNAPNKDKPDPITQAYERGDMTREQADAARRAEKQMKAFIARTVDSLNRRFGDKDSTDEKPVFAEGVDIEKVTSEIVALTMFEITLMTMLNRIT